MHDPKTSDREVQRFEKEVQQKMEELEFSPSAAVWANVEKAVRVEKKRRVPFFWLFFLPALLLMGGAGFYFMGSHKNPSSLNANKMTGQASKAAKGSGRSNDQPGNSQPINDQQPGDQPANSPQPGNATLANTQPVNDLPSTDPLKKLNQPTKNDQAPVPTKLPIDEPTASGASRSNTLRPEATAAAATTHARTHRTSSRHLAGKGIANPLTEEDPGSRDQSLAANTKPLDQSTIGKGDAIPLDKPAASASIHLNPVNVKSIVGIQAAPLAKSPALARTRLTPKRAWEAGFTGGVGMSSLNQTLFKRSAVTANDTRNLAAPIPVTGAAAPTYVSKIRPDLSFWAGIFVQKAILNNISVSIGLNLHYYSTKVYTGEKVVNNASNYYYYTSSSSLLAYAAAPTPAQSYPYYAAGDKQTFINRYYFLEIPGSIQWQISHNRIMPLFWEVGGSLSYLMSSNAIYYNSKAGVYYKDGNVSNKTQFNVSTALMVGIPLKGLQMQVGPQLQYGFTNLLNTQSSGGQHLFYGGLKLVIFPGKSHKIDRHRFREE
ncbi:MAG TPA: outer membrane beta-barrel protein [Puia sp.]